MNKPLIVAKYLALLPFHLGVKVAAWCCAPIAAKWFSDAITKHLKSPFLWMDTVDDMAYYTGSLTPWYQQNGGNWFNYNILGVTVLMDWLNQYRSPVNGVISGGPVWWTDNAFCMRKTILGFTIDAGWNLLGPHDGRAKYWLSARKYKPDPNADPNVKVTN